MNFSLPNLPYSYDSLEPFIDAKTMEIHHSKHHATYINKLNEAIEIRPEHSGKTLEDLLIGLENIPEDIRTAVRNNGGGHYNHSFFWDWMTPDPTKNPIGKLEKEMNDAFGSFGQFKEMFTEEALNIFGSGWGWLVLDGKGKLAIVSTPKQDNPIMEGHRPLLGIDVWEHAYYLKYQNKRADYIENWWNVVNWEKISLDFGNL